MIVEIECIPNPPGTDTDRYAYVDAAIAVVQRSGLNHVVGPLGTTFEGAPDEVWMLLRQVHEACLKAGASSLVSQIKVAQSRDGGPTMSALTEKFQQGSADR